MRNMERIILSYKNTQRSFKSLNEVLLVNPYHDFFKNLNLLFLIVN